MSRSEMFTVKEVKRAIKGSYGIKRNVYQKLKCSWQTLNKYLLNYPSLQRRLDKEAGSLNDFVNSKMIENIDENDTSMIQFYQRTKNGYKLSQGLDHTSSDGSMTPIEARVMMLPVNSRVLLDDTEDFTDEDGDIF